MQGKTIAGRLAGVDGPRAVITLQTRDKRRIYIRFSELRYLNFIARNPINRNKHPLQQTHANDIVMPKGAQDFRVTFVDQKALNGRTRSSFVDKFGIHLFQLVDSTHVSRLFIPAQSVSRYYIGRRIDPQGSESVVHDLKTRTKSDAAISPRRRKSDREHKGTTTDAQALKQALTSRAEAEELTSLWRIGEMLVKDGIVTQDQLNTALEHQKNDASARIGEIFVKMGVTSSEQIYTTLAHKFGLPFVLLRNLFIDMECINLVPADVAHKYTLVPLLLHNDRLVVAMDDPANTEALTLLNFITRYRIEPTIATREDITWAIDKYYGQSSEASAKKSPTQPHTESSDNAAAPQETRETINRKTIEKAIASFIANTVADAVNRGASDIQFAATGTRTSVLFRISGELVPVRRVSHIIVPAILNHLHAMITPAHKGQSSQPGYARIINGEEVIDAYIDISRKGNDAAVIRLIRTGVQLPLIPSLGLQETEFSQLNEVLMRQGRLFLVAGPAESHRSRTLYAALRQVRENGRHVATAEWPVSYYLNGVTQIHPHNGDTSSFIMQALSDTSRFDCLLINEIADRASLDTAITATLKGMTVMSKLEAVTATQAVARLASLTNRRSELATMLGGILVQHRVRVNCHCCLVEEKIEGAARDTLGVGRDEVFYRGKGCEECKGTGYCGSQLVFELMPNSLELSTLLGTGATQDKIAEWAAERGIAALQENALELARQRRIPLAEAHRLHLLTRD
ncbi:MAG: Flp pilus assembly complex ATPase component TadA [Chromatiales bacterium]|nr:Flp pilus assembly complex ATPase component TadA [Chromatiales bacterium]